ncbi:MAG: SRPBCC domain-containing protein [Burkholderiales bacterium]|nr:SRPBCC domain-containing protein [Burkholderiales bacterium]
MSEPTTLREPVRHAVDVALPLERAFELFTRDVARWWPLASHSCSQEKGATVRFGAGIGAQVVERGADGRDHVWGTITQWQPPHGFEMTWHPGQDAAQATALEVRFEPRGEGCRVSVRHGGWEARGANAAELRDNYDRGWVYVLGCYSGSTRSGG